ncbi:MAG TPA: hypothetical protein VL137_17550 [Polyangiaceae bacterium]|nr:hypothetical protein [Polyangiaceae bacterium]
MTQMHRACTQSPRRLSMSLATMLLIGMGAAQANAADTVVQIPLTGVLDARSVSTFTAGAIVTWDLPTDGGNLQNAFATKAVAMQTGTPPEHALPDDGVFPADTRHPEVVLNFSNTADAMAPQTHLIEPMGSISFPVPTATYSKFFLFFNGAAGGTTVTVTLHYGAASEMYSAMVPDYYADISATDPMIFNLAADLAKYSATNTIAEAGHHNITGVEVHPLSDQMLTTVDVSRTADGNLVFWGATGVATSAVAMGGAGNGGASNGGAPGSGGAAGAPQAGGGGAASGGQSTGGMASGGTPTGGAAGSPSAAGGSGGNAGVVAGSAGTSTGGMMANLGGTAGMPPVASGGAPAAAVPAADSSGSGCGIAGVPMRPTHYEWIAIAALCVLRKRRYG